MTSILSVSSAEISQRRRNLRRQRRRQLVYGVWRILAVSSLAGGLVWGATQPVWVIRQPEQINIEGNRILSAQKIRSLLSLSYPQSLLRIEPQTLAEQLESGQSMISKATVSRQLFPPSLTVKVEERQPVAMVKRGKPIVVQLSDKPEQNNLPSASPEGLIDINGNVISGENYKVAGQSLPSPPLLIIGDRQQYLPYWFQMYQTLRRSPVKVSEIDWQNPADVILKTEIGIVHLGMYGPQLADQLAVLDKMRRLPEKVNGSTIEYIDLRDPDAPAVKLQEGSTTALPPEVATNLKLGSKRTVPVD